MPSPAAVINWQVGGNSRLDESAIPPQRCPPSCTASPPWLRECTCPPKYGRRAIASIWLSCSAPCCWGSATTPMSFQATPSKRLHTAIRQTYRPSNHSHPTPTPLSAPSHARSCPYLPHHPPHHTPPTTRPTTHHPPPAPPPAPPPLQSATTFNLDDGKTESKVEEAATPQKYAVRPAVRLESNFLIAKAEREARRLDSRRPACRTACE